MRLNQGGFMKLILTFVLALSAAGALAQEDLNTLKSKANSHLNKKLSSLETAKSCINSADSIEKFKACKYDMYEDMKKNKKQAMEEKVDDSSSEE